MKVIPKSKQLEEKLMADLDLEKLSMDPATQELIKKAQAEGIETIWDRATGHEALPHRR